VGRIRAAPGRCGSRRGTSEPRGGGILRPRRERRERCYRPQGCVCGRGFGGRKVRARVSLFVGSSVWYAAADRGKSRAKKILSAADRRVTTDYVLVETWVLLRHRLNREAAERFWDGPRRAARTARTGIVAAGSSPDGPPEPPSVLAGQSGPSRARPAVGLRDAAAPGAAVAENRQARAALGLLARPLA